ncbi:hypothetical protein DH2020_025164 [Rehmannia glutinosa]|uniref:Uncharacterized protein n=1 Tax=Rehmannia glutinosa TaxID=99300 RepID=A0ABR0W0D7_REHGL
MFLTKLIRMRKHIGVKSRGFVGLRKVTEIQKYFHASTIQRRKSNCIERLIRNDGSYCETVEEIEAEICDSYQQLFQSSSPVEDQFILEGISCSISAAMNLELTSHVEDVEIKRALFRIQPNKAPPRRLKAVWGRAKPSWVDSLGGGSYQLAEDHMETVESPKVVISAATVENFKAGVEVGCVMRRKESCMYGLFVAGVTDPVEGLPWNSSGPILQQRCELKKGGISLRC